MVFSYGYLFTLKIHFLTDKYYTQVSSYYFWITIMEHLIVTVLGPDKHGIANEIFKLTAHCNCHIADARITAMDTEFTATFLLAGNWNALAKFEASLPRLEKKHDLHFLCRRSQPITPTDTHLPYLAYIVAPDTPAAIHKITQFLVEETIVIHELSANTYKAPHSELSMLNITIAFSIPTNKVIADFRERFALFCDDNNLDVAMEPRKN